jgi:hypothetical protein
MAPRIRTVKPDLFQHEALYDAEETSGLPVRLAFIGLFTECDREGRFKWRPRTLKAQIMPFDSCDFEAVLDVLETHRFIIRYTVDGEDYGLVPTFLKHQAVNTREAKSTLPEPPPCTHVQCTEAHVQCTEAHVQCTATHVQCTATHVHANAGKTHAKTGEKTGDSDARSNPLVQHGKNAEDADEIKEAPQGTCMHVHAQGEGKGRRVNLKPKTKGSTHTQGHNSRVRAREGPDVSVSPHDRADEHAPPSMPSVPTVPTGPATLCLAMRQAGVQGAQPSHPRIIALAKAGVTPDAVRDACHVAEENLNGQPIAVNYVATILERWQAEGRQPRAARGHVGVANGERFTFDERAKDRKTTFDALTGRNRTASGGDVIDVPMPEIKS